MILLIKGEPLGGRELTEPVSLSAHLSSLTLSLAPRLAKTSPFVILLCLTPDDRTRQGRASGWERDNMVDGIMPMNMYWGILKIIFPYYINNNIILIIIVPATGVSGKQDESPENKT